MHAFNIMAEAKMRQWAKTTQEAKAASAGSPKAAHTPAPAFESLESKLHGEITALLDNASGALGAERETLLRQAEELRVQLAARLERDGYHLLARHFTESIQAYRTRKE